MYVLDRKNDDYINRLTLLNNENIIQERANVIDDLP